MAARWFGRCRWAGGHRCRRRRRDAVAGTTRAVPNASPPAPADPAPRARRAAASPCGYGVHVCLARDVLAGSCAELYLGPALSAGHDLQDSVRHRILLLGNPSSRPEGLERVLVRSGFQVTEAPSASPPDLLLFTPDPGLASVAEEVRGLVRDPAYGGAPVFVLLDSGKVNAATEALLAGASDALVGPIHLPELRARLDVQIHTRAEVREAQEALRARDLLFDIFQEVSSALRPDEIFQTLVRRVGQAFGLSHCSFVLTAPGDDKGRVVAVYENPAIRDLRVDLGRYPEIQEAIRTERPVVIQNVHEDPLFASIRQHWNKQQIEVNVQAAVALPVFVQGRAAAVFFLRTEKGDPQLRAADVAFANTIAQAAARVLENEERRSAIYRRQISAGATDELTGCASLDALDRRLRDEVERARRYSLHFSLVVIDIDQLRDINDRLGQVAWSLRRRDRVPAQRSAATRGPVHAGRGRAAESENRRPGPHRRRGRELGRYRRGRGARSQLPGSSAMPPWPRVSKWRCGPSSIDSPPTWPINWARITRSPWRTVAACALQRLDPVVERVFVALKTREPLLRLLRAAARRAQVGLPLVLERQVAAQLVGALAAAPAQCLARIHEQLALPRDAVAQLVHVVGEQAILPAHEIEIFVARQQVSEALCGKQHLPAVQRAALVDVHEPPLQHRALFEQRVLRDQQVDRDLIDLPAEPGDLAVQLVDDAVRALLLLLDVGDFVGEGMALGAEPLELLLDVGSLTLDAFQAPLILLHLLLIGGTLLGDNGSGNQQEQQCFHTRFKWRPTLSALPTRPISAPNATMATPCSCVKNDDCSKYRLIKTYAANDKPIATAPPSSPLIAPWSKKGRRMKPSVAPTSRMIAISRLRCSTAIRIVVPMMMMATTANAAPTTMPTAAASPRSLSTFSTQSRPKRTSSTNPNPRSRSATALTCSASRNPGLSFTSIEAGNGLRSSSCITSRSSISSARARASASSSETYVADCTSGNASMSLSAWAVPSIGAPGSK